MFSCTTFKKIFYIPYLPSYVKVPRHKTSLKTESMFSSSLDFAKKCCKKVCHSLNFFASSRLQSVRVKTLFFIEDLVGNPCYLYCRNVRLCFAFELGLRMPTNWLFNYIFLNDMLTLWKIFGHILHLWFTTGTFVNIRICIPMCIFKVIALVGSILKNSSLLKLQELMSRQFQMNYVI